MRTTLIETAGWVTGEAINVALIFANVQASGEFNRERSLTELTAAFDIHGFPCSTDDDAEDVIRITVER